MTWTEKRQTGWMQRDGQKSMASPLKLPTVLPTLPAVPSPPSPIVLPTYPAFSPAAVAKVLGVPRSTVGYWLSAGKLDHYRDCLHEPYVLRSELIRFIRDYLQRCYVDADS